ncbi:PREDICTED: nuclear RNA export factor 1-like [Ceratosolen solmsi marchali]|uniref:Nuclear RNA export factor 1-like n=1 Tax=Ceratosolen solmsi marchali TaxID=326594 RepID=A0AAJ6YNY1_9HYME|nr:PREDICTED: nuclear RNA export factor 1-like [Ceratosolen solmsi marchali]
MQSNKSTQPNTSSQRNGSSPVSPVILDSSSAIKLSMGTMMYHERALMARNDIWHRILILRGGLYDKEVILKSILNAVNPADLIPVKYQIIGEDSCFIARNCDRALDQLCKSSLIVQCLDGSPLILSITLAFASIHDLKINIQPLLLTVLRKRYNAEKKLLILDNFHKDPEIYKTVYCPLSQCKTMIHVLKLSKTALGPFEYLSLQNNELSQLTVLESTNIKSIKYLDLRHNNILQIDELQPLKTLSITELWIDGNPLCENYSSASQYVEAVKHYCSSVYKLDGVLVNSVGLPLVFKSYVKNWKKRKLVEQFIQHFFTAYDNRDRSVMRGLYHDNAWYSTTVGMASSLINKKYLEHFSQENRNLLIFGKNNRQCLYYGQEQILNILKQMPASQHIYNSFCCDLMYSNNDLLTISVEGLFKLCSASNQIYCFNRTFIISEEEDNEFKLLNDQYHIYLPIHEIDYIIYNIENENPPTFKATCFSPSEKENLILTLQESTMMTLDYCEQYLKDAAWDLRKTIINFLHHYKNGQIPKDAFNK